MFRDKPSDFPPNADDAFRNFTNIHRGFTMDHRQEAVPDVFAMRSGIH
jgi:hypothetical protein